MSKRSTLLPALEKTLDKLQHRLPESICRMVFDDPDRQREMRSDRDESLRRVLSSLVRHMDAASCKAVKMVGKNKAIPWSLTKIVKETNLSRQTVISCIQWLEGHGLLRSEGQVRRTAETPNGKKLAATSVYRQVCDKLFALLGLLGDVIAMRRFKAADGLQFGHEVVLIGISGPIRGSRRVIREAPPDRRPEPPKPDIHAEQLTFAELLRRRTGIDISKLTRKV